MAKKFPPKSEHSEKVCPIFLTLGIIANKRSITLFYHLSQAEENTLRFNQLKKLLTGISQRELSKHLKEFEKAGLVSRKIFAEVPPRVEYTLTKLGKTLNTPIAALSLWAEQHGAQVQANRTAFTVGKS